MSLFNNAIIGASGQQGYQISRSVRLRSSASAYFNRTPAGAGNGTTWTFSCWLKRGAFSTSSYLPIYSSGASAYNVWFGFANISNSGGGYSGDYIYFNAGNGSTQVGFQTLAVFRDPSAWYHIVLKYDSSNATAANRVNLYVNGVLQAWDSSTTVSQNFATDFNTANQKTLSSNKAISGTFFDGYLTEINFIDGQALTPTSFGQFNSVTGVWQPIKYTGTYGTNGFYLNFSDNSNNTATTIGKDYSGNGNNWTPNNISVTSGSTYDSMIDVPTLWADGGNGRGNYCVMNPIDNGGVTLSNANLTITGAGSAFKIARSTLGLSSGKWYCEFVITSEGAPSRIDFGLLGSPATLSGFLGDTSNGYAIYESGGNIVKYNNSSASTLVAGGALDPGDVQMLAYDADAGKLWFGKNGSWFASGDPAAGTNPVFSSVTGQSYFVAVQAYNTSDVGQINFGQRPFSYTPPSGFKALNTQNLPAPTISNGALYMAATTYTGTGASNTISNGNNNTIGTTFKPDLVWIKSRSAATDHKLTDSVRGTTKALISDTTGAETTDANGLTAFGNTGFTVGSDTTYNNNTATYVGWQWQAGAGTTSSNTSGSITSTVSVNATAGFSVVTYTGNSTANASVGHGLGVSPNLVIIKARTSGSVENWPVYHSSLSAGQFLFLNTTNAVQSADGTFNSSTPVSSTVFQFGSPTNTRTNSSSYSYVAYCFSAVRGYSAFGSYTSNQNADGPFIYLGFRPRFVLIKRTDSAQEWVIDDTGRSPYNQTAASLLPNSSGSEGTGNNMDILSNGFKIRTAGDGINYGVGGTYIYAAFAENPFKLALAR